MRCTTKYVGLDVHQAITSASVRREGGQVIARTILSTAESAIGEFLGRMRGAVQRVVVCDRRGEPRQGNKADLGDADRLSGLLHRGGLRAVYHGGASRATLKELTRGCQNLVDDSTRLMLRLRRSCAPVQSPPAAPRSTRLGSRPARRAARDASLQRARYAT